MNLNGAAVVITGGGSGIGAAMARRFAGLGAQIVVNDLDAAAARQVAYEVDGLAFSGDAGDPEEVDRLVDFAWDNVGALDLFCANAGVAPRGTVTAPDAMWEQAWRVNVMAHVYASRALLPRWLAKGRGRLLTTVSAAGLLTLLGKAPYAVTKHAALAYAEWLRVTYAHRGIVVQALCPQGVRTPMLDGGDGASRRLLDRTALAPEQVADRVVEALGGDRFLILPHPEVATYYARRAADPDRWLDGMNRLQQKIEG
ncbi:SDR family NAD(P)-dependent oxidoreductase [Dactylosporangium sucinum]|uniref:Dehydrogenase n=1 Tax=Dactylosporangium sucinum TaxID=1424081 RepID=A0A917UD90_9ACTN|nr:SDR family oxidoreductase [Dactylosporangium sucinum]GGM76797.1 dehydrogenase [Dactylosporangium sucinum]